MTSVTIRLVLAALATAAAATANATSMMSNSTTPPAGDQEWTSKTPTHSGRGDAKQSRCRLTAKDPFVHNKVLIDTHVIAKSLLHYLYVPGGARKFLFLF